MGFRGLDPGLLGRTPPLPYSIGAPSPLRDRRTQPYSISGPSLIRSELPLPYSIGGPSLTRSEIGAPSPPSPLLDTRSELPALFIALLPLTSPEVPLLPGPSSLPFARQGGRPGPHSARAPSLPHNCQPRMQSGVRGLGCPRLLKEIKKTTPLYPHQPGGPSLTRPELPPFRAARRATRP